MPKAIPDDIKQVIGAWNGIISQMTGLTRNYLKKSVRSLGANGELLLVYDDRNAYAYAAENRSGCIDLLKAAVSERIGKEIEIGIRLNQTEQPAENLYPDLGRFIKMEIEEED